MWKVKYHLYWVFTYIYSPLIEKGISYSRNVSVKLLCVYVCLSSGDLFIFFRKRFFFFAIFVTTWKGKYRSTDNSINRKRKGTHQKIKRSPDKSTHEHKHTATWNILAITDAFLDQKRVNVCEHPVKMVAQGRHLYHVFTYIYSLLIEKDICDHRNISSFHMFVFICTFVYIYYPVRKISDLLFFF